MDVGCAERASSSPFPAGGSAAPDFHPRPARRKKTPLLCLQGRRRWATRPETGRRGTYLVRELVGVTLVDRLGGEEEGDTEETDVEEFGDEGDEDLELEDSDDEIKDIQSTTGKLGQQLRDVEDISSDMQKWVAKSVLSALDLDTMDSEDKKDIIKTIKKKEEEPTEEESGEEDFDFGGEEEEMEESYDNYMGGDYDDDMDGMDGYGCVRTAPG